MNRALGCLMVLIVLAGIAGPLIVAGDVLVGAVEGRSDPAGDSLQFATQAADITKYLLTLATGIVGLVGFLMSEKLTDYWQELTGHARGGVLFGVVFALLSVWTGLVVLWTLLDLTVMQLVRGQLQRVVVLHVIEVLELAVGVALIGLAVLPKVVASNGGSDAQQG